MRNCIKKFIKAKFIIALFLTGNAILAVSCGTSSSSGSSSIGKTGSTARFAIAGDVLYTLSSRPRSDAATPPSPASPWYAQSGEPIIRTFDITEPSTPLKSTDVPIYSWPETLFSNGSQIFVGALTGMEIYELIEPLRPRFQSQVSHIRACDPVVTEGTKAYVTLRGGSGCFNQENVLEIIDFTNPTAPIKLNRFAMNAPFGLAVQDGRAFICDGPAGLRVLDVKDHAHIKDLPSVPVDICTDVILSGQRLITTGFTGLAQYEVSQSPPRKLSVIPISEDLSSGATQSIK